MDAAEDRAERPAMVGAEDRIGIDAPALAGTHHILNVLGAERRHAADRARAIDVGRGTAHDVDAADQFWIEEERAVRVVAGALIVLARAVDDDRDAAEVLQAANVDRCRWVVAAILYPDTGHQFL